MNGWLCLFITREKPMSSLSVLFVLLSVAVFTVYPHLSHFRSLYALRSESSAVAMPVEHFIQEFNSPTVSSCLRSCLRENRCISFLFNKEKQLCRVYSNVISISDTFALKQNWKYYHVYHERCPVSENYFFDATLGLCIKPYVKKLIHTDATTYCGKDRATLVRIDSEEKWKFIKEILSDIPLSLFYVQGSYNQGQLLYDNGENVTYIEWVNIPEEVNDNFGLILSKSDGYKWLNTPKLSSNGCICQKSIKYEQED